MKRNTSHYYLRGRPNTPLSSDSCMSQACEHTWYTEGIIFTYIILGVNREVERNSHSQGSYLNRKVLPYSADISTVYYSSKSEPNLNSTLEVLYSEEGTT